MKRMTTRQDIGSQPHLPKDEQAAVLVVDDNQTMRSLIEGLLSRWGFSPITAPDGKAALRKLSEHRVGVVITDYEMPALNGLELLEQVHARNSHIPVIVLQPRPVTALLKRLNARVCLRGLKSRSTRKILGRRLPRPHRPLGSNRLRTPEGVSARDRRER